MGLSAEQGAGLLAQSENNLRAAIRRLGTQAY
jgi:hypothetical protein